jgi:hypothetical protein
MGDNARTLEFRPTTLELFCASGPGTSGPGLPFPRRVPRRSIPVVSASTPDTVSTVARTEPNAYALIGQPFEALGN